jgi:hypothetical protein
MDEQSAAAKLKDLFPLSHKKFPWSKVCVTGGAVMQSLLYTDIPIKDIDIFVPVRSYVQIAEIQNEILQLFPQDALVVQSFSSVSIFQRGSAHFTQIIFVMARDPFEIVSGFDLACNMVWFDGEEFQMLEEWKQAVSTKSFCVNTKGRDGQYFSEKRIARAESRGWAVQRNANETGRNTAYDSSRDFIWEETWDVETATEKLKNIFKRTFDHVDLLQNIRLDNIPFPLKYELLKTPHWTFTCFKKTMILETFAPHSLLDRAFTDWHTTSLSSCVIEPFHNKLGEFAHYARRFQHIHIPCFPGYTWLEIARLYYDEDKNALEIHTLQSKKLDVTSFNVEHKLGVFFQTFFHYKFWDRHFSIRSFPRIALNHVHVRLVSDMFYYDYYAIVELVGKRWMPCELLARFRNESSDFIMEQRDEFQHDVNIFFERQDTLFIALDKKIYKKHDLLKCNLLWGPGTCQRPTRLNFIAVESEKVDILQNAQIFFSK